jgi:hypothetical protein
MIINEKVSKALKSATTHLENSMIALNKEDEKMLADSFWHVAAELEYALFLFSIACSDEINLLSSKRNPESKKTETDSMLAEVKNLLNEAESYAANEKSVDAYKKAYVARNYVLKIQRDFTKKK